MPSNESSTPPSSAPSLRLDYKKLEMHLLALINLARRAYEGWETQYERMGIVANLLDMRLRLSYFFSKYRLHDYVADRAYGYCLEISELLHLIEVKLAVEERPVDPLQGIIRDGEWYTKGGEGASLWKRICMDIELLVFGDWELDCEKLPWNRAPAEVADSARPS